MYVHDIGGVRFLAVNDAMVEKYGFSREEFGHITMKDVRPASEFTMLLDHLAHKAPGLIDAGYWTHLDAAGREFPVHVHTRVLVWDGQEAEVVMVEEVAKMA